MNRTTPNIGDAQTVALAALAATLSHQHRAERLLALTGIGPAELRERVGDPELLSAVLRFLEDHEPDLVAVADAIGARPAQLVDARIALDRGAIEQ